MTEFQKSLQSVCDNMIKTASYAISYLDENNRQKALKSLRENIEAYVKSAETVDNLKSIMKESLANITSDMSADQRQLIEEFNEKTSSFSPDISDHAQLKEYDDSIKKLMECLAGVQVNNEDDDMQITENVLRTSANLLCPVSKTRMTDPMKNTICGHIYDKASLVALLSTGNNTRCPTVGCSNQQHLEMSHIKPDIVTRILLDASSE